MKQLRTRYLAFASIFILMSACAPAQVLPTQISTSVIKPTRTVEAKRTPSQIATNIPTATAKLTCPKINSSIQFTLALEPTEFEESILNYLNEGGDPAKIDTKAGESGMPPLYVLSADIDGDSLSEVVVNVGNFFGDPTIIHLYHCEQNNYQLAKTFTLDKYSFAKPEFATRIFNTEPHFIIVRAGYNIAGWDQDFLAIGWRKSEWRLSRLATGTTPSTIVLFDRNADGTKEIFVKTRTAATPGGGISRVIIDSYSWDGNGFALISSDMPPGNDRVHYLGDAETAWKNGNPLLAISFYEIAARDPNLSSYWTTYELGTRQEELASHYQQAFAFFRIIAIWLYLDRPDRAFEYIQEISEAFPEGKPGSEFVLAVKTLSESYNKGPDFSNSCAQAVKVLDTKYPDIVRNHLGDWGVANPIYLATSDICKFE